MILQFLVTFFGIGLLHGLAPILTAESFPTKFRYSGTGISYSISAIMGGMVAPSLLAGLIGRDVVHKWFYVPVVYAVYWQGSDEAWLDAGTSTSLPGDCLSLSTIQSDGLSWEEYAANTQHTITTANGYYYSVGATITSPYGGPSVSFTSTTAYNQHTTEAFSFQSQYSYYYLYANSYYSGQDTNWPIVFSSNTAC